MSCCVSAALGCASPYEPEGEFWSNPGSASSTAPVDGVATNEPTVSGATAAPSTGSSTPVAEGIPSDTPLDEGTPSDTPLDESTSANNAGATQGNSDSSAESGSSMGEPSATGGAGPSTQVPESQTCSLSVSVTTTAPGGKYRPRNVGAIWVADSSGEFIKSLDVWGNRRLSHVVAWTAATRAAGLSGNKVDAVTSATLSAHRAHDVTWDCRNTSDQLVPDGTYQVHFEVTDSNNAGPAHFETFTKGPMAATVQSSATNFDGIALTFTP